MSDPLEDAALSTASYAATCPVATDAATIPCTADNAALVTVIIGLR